jgi:hypothetical protein
MINKSHYLKSYYNYTSKHLITSKFIYDCVNDIPKIDNLRLTIESNDIKKAHYLAIFILSKGFLPYLKKYYKKKNARSNIITKSDRFFFLDIKKNNIFPIISFVMQKLLIGNINTEQSPLSITKNQAKFILWNTPLVSEIKKLQSPHGYIPNIPIGFSFKLSNNGNNTLYEKLFFLRHMHLISFQEIPGLDKKNNKYETTL